MPPKTDPEVGCEIPEPGKWPVDPQEDIPIAEDRLWIDGCFDFFHHGHAGLMLQSRRLGSELLVGLHSDEEIRANKGPTVMSLKERVAAVEACRFSTKCVPDAPYVTSLPWISHYGCQYVTHGDDITSDASGNDCYRFVKKAGRMKIVPRTPGISTTDLVGRMLLCTKDHFIHSLTNMLRGREGAGNENERVERGQRMADRISAYASAADGRSDGVQVYSFKGKHRSIERRASRGQAFSPEGRRPDSGRGSFVPMVHGVGPRSGQRIVYVDGGFDLFSSGHIAFLRTVTSAEEDLGRARGWYNEEARSKRTQDHGEDFPPAFVVAGIHDDEVVNYHKGLNYPIMNVFERGLCVVQCRYIHQVVFGAPYVPTEAYLASLPAVMDAPTASSQARLPDAVYHGPTANISAMSSPDPYADAKAHGIFFETPSHDFQDVNAAQIVRRILNRREEYEERQRKKGVKGAGEGALRRKEMEAEAEQIRLRKLQDVEAQYGA
ncbi:choline phosphate cytidylyltransferase [Friedmanniomyces endolithicus]|uniref:ethanolamine-phosphate cytidylyltransferase n=1 Tax=Friedmanniomyces endolithicus TaxID=329885 RepID=A0AAN6R293_9PEZI|nr:choline phosphate cytidylyltransferase [Friedmanniomyces endolithicus]KAK0972162.1 choline phosphate cytidylyltransferase [Friedmanniomyces endolithicus]KAK1014947.1 choline phosphate cytidylyltransferase [Friedmanniomyces endolithicus]KAK1039145.1 choline phosphate cytidylyltransferase [Friedmanniomyces endolithicus]